MAGSLIKIAESTVTSATANVTLTGIDSTYDVYMLSINNVVASADGKQLTIRVTASGTAKDTSDYDHALKSMYTAGSFINQGVVNMNAWLESTFSSGNGTGEGDSGIVYLYNFNNSSEFSFVTREQVSLSHVAQTQGVMGGGVHTVASASDGVNYFMASGNLTGGTFTLFKVV